MKTKPPKKRRKFLTEWDEIEYLYDKLLYWLYHREDVPKARRYAERLEQVLAEADPDQEAILGAECRSLVHEARGDLHKAIHYREHEIQLMRRLHEISRDSPNKEWVLEQRGYDDLADRLDLLAILYHDSGNLDKAIGTLRESKQLCRKYAVKFDGADLLRDYLEEQREDLPTKRNGQSGGSARRAKPKPSLADRGR